VTRARTARPNADALFATRKATAKIPFDFVLTELESLAPFTRRMFGCYGVYVDDRIVFMLRDKGASVDDGVWIATTREHHESLRDVLPNMRSITVFASRQGEQGEATGWQVPPADANDFEDSVLRACALVRDGDARIGKVPASRKKKRTK